MNDAERAREMAGFIKSRGTRTLHLFPAKPSGRGTAAEFRVALLKALGLRPEPGAYYSTCKATLAAYNVAAQRAGYEILEVDPSEYDAQTIRAEIAVELRGGCEGCGDPDYSCGDPCPSCQHRVDADAEEGTCHA